MVDSRQKGARAEAALVTQLKKDTNLNWKRVPGSGALDAAHGLKGDVYVPNEKNYWCIEVKHYKDSHLTSKVLTDKTPQLLEWWGQSVRQGKQTDKDPILFFKHDRSKWFVAMPLDYVLTFPEKYFTLEPEHIIILEYSKWATTILPEITWIQ
jgi:Holliday junction resolvase